MASMDHDADASADADADMDLDEPIRAIMDKMQYLKHLRDGPVQAQICLGCCARLPNSPADKNIGVVCTFIISPRCDVRTNTLALDHLRLGFVCSDACWHRCRPEKHTVAQRALCITVASALAHVGATSSAQRRRVRLYPNMSDNDFMMGILVSEIIHRLNYLSSSAIELNVAQAFADLRAIFASNIARPEYISPFAPGSEEARIFDGYLEQIAIYERTRGTPGSVRTTPFEQTIITQVPSQLGFGAESSIARAIPHIPRVGVQCSRICLTFPLSIRDARSGERTTVSITRNTCSTPPDYEIVWDP